MSIQAIGIGGIHNIDYEHKRIINELQALGITPTYDKNIDRAKLNAEKSKLIDKISHKIEHKNEQANTNFKDTVVAYHQTDEERINLEEQKPGAMTLSELNKIYFGL